jgi:predicted permease
MFSEQWQDIRYAACVLIAAPGFAIAAIISVGCGIGMGTTVYSQLDSFIFRPVPGIVDSPSLVAIRAAVSFPAYEAFRDKSEQYDDVAAYMGPIPMARNDSRPPVRLWGQFVTTNYFHTLATPAQLGRVFGAEEARRGIGPLAVISDKLWHEQWRAAPDVIGESVRLNGRLVTIIGVAAPGFRGASPLMSAADIWIPLTVDPAFAPELGSDVLNDRDASRFSVIGRLRPGVSAGEAEARLDTVLKQVADTTADDPGARGRRVVFVPGGRRLPLRDVDLPALIAVPAVLVGLMLWIACSNVGTMLVARAHARRMEIAIRLSVGANRWRLVRQLLTESVLLALGGGVLGFLIALWLRNWSARSMKDFAPGFVDLTFPLDWAAMLFTFFLSLLSGVMFGLAPALQATRGDLTQSLKPGSSWRLGGFRWFGTRNILVLQQVAGSLMLLLITGFVVLGIQRSSSVDPGCDTRNLYMMSVDPLRDGYAVEEAEDFLGKIRDRIKRMPGVADAK